MPTYVYETLPPRKGARIRRYEIKQSIKEAALVRHPETGEPIKRVIAGGVGVLTSPSAHTHTSSCGCGAGDCHR
jgi:predicted nucleic acid-binding Zn ribbon protein